MAQLALGEFEAHGVTLLVAEAQVRVARLAHLLGQQDDAARAAAAAEVLFRRQRRPAWAALSRVQEVEACVAIRGVTAADVAVLRRAAGVIERAGIVSWAADADLSAGRWAAELGKRRAAIACFTDTARLTRGGPALLRLKGHLARARLAEMAADDRRLLASSRAGLRELARHRTALSSIELRTLASGHGTELGELSLRAVLRDGRPGQVLQEMERTRAAALLRTEDGAQSGAGHADRRVALGAIRAGRQPHRERS